MTPPRAAMAEAPPSAVAAPAAPNERWSARLFWVAVVAALPLLLWVGRDHWFFLDEWWVLVRDGLTRPGYLDGHNGHWITLLRLEYRLNFQLWGLRTYLPYQLPVVLAHLGAAVLLRRLMCRTGVRGWIATATAVAFLFFGSGRENMAFGFQISLTGSLVCGLALFLLTDGPRTVTKRDGLGLGLAVAGLMTSSVFVAVLVGFGLTTLLRRGVRLLAFYGLALGTIYVAWYLRYGRDTAEPLRLTARALRFLGRMLWSVFDALAQGGAGALLLAVGAFGLAVAVARARRSGAWGEAAVLPGLALGWLTFASLTSMARAEPALTADSYDAGRYLHVGAALLLPLVAAGAEELARHRAVLGALALLPLAVGLPGNLDRLTHMDPIFRENPELFGPDSREILLAMAHSPLIDDVPPDTVPINGFGDLRLTAGWLARHAADGRIPEPDHAADPSYGLTATSYLVLDQEPGPAAQPPCPPLASPLRMELDAGDVVRFSGTIRVTVIDDVHASRPRELMSGFGPMIRTLAGPIDVVVEGVDGQSRACARAR